MSSSPQKGQKNGTARAVGSTGTSCMPRADGGTATAMTSLTRVTASVALAALAVLTVGACSGNQSGDSVTDNQDRVTPPTASPSS
jgi:hypothetical protein